MPILPTFRLPLLSLFLLPSLAAAGWLPTNGPEGKSVVGLVADGSDLYVLAEAGLFRSRDAAASWQPIPADFGKQLRSGLAARGGEIFVATLGGVYRRAGEGASWSKVNSNLEDTTVQTLAISADGVLAGTQRLGHLYRSADRGASWTRLNPSVRMGSMLQITVDGPRIHAATAEGIQFSPDGGATWSKLLPGGGDDEIRTVVRTDTFLYARTLSHIYRSGDGGRKWTRVTPPGLPTLFPDFKSFTAVGPRLYATSLKLGLFRSVDHGDTWIRDTLHFHASSYWGSNFILLPHGQDLFAGGASGVHRSRDQGLRWVGTNTGFGGGGIADLLGLEPGRLLAATNGGWFATSDYGVTWIRNPPASPGLNISRFARLGRFVLTSSSDQGVYRSSDGGRTWDTLPGPGNARVGSMLQALGGSVYLPIAGKGVYRSEDTGLTWKLTAGLGQAQAGEMTLGEGGRIFAATDDGLHVLQGEAWTPVAGGLRGEWLFHVAASGSALLATTLKGALWRSSDQGATWSRPLDSARTGQVTGVREFGGRVYAGADSGIFVSADHGGRWTAVDATGLPARWSAGTLAVHGDSLFAYFRNEGIWKRPLSEIGPVGIATGHPPSAPTARPAVFRRSGRLGFSPSDGKQAGYDAGGKALPP